MLHESLTVNYVCRDSELGGKESMKFSKTVHFVAVSLPTGTVAKSRIILCKITPTWPWRYKNLAFSLKLSRQMVLHPVPVHEFSISRQMNMGV